jgi:DNA-binding response OmpR family regulator
MRKKILVVDDDAAVRESLACALSYENFLVLPAADGEEALKMAAATPVDLVLLDLNMPVKSGWDIFERLTGEHPLVPVIIVTARPNQLFTALGAGAGALMEKPLDFPELLRTIRRLIAEPIDVRLARLAGRPTEFDYRPARGEPLVDEKE